MARSGYSLLVKMIQPFVVRYPLIKGQGNFGSINGDYSAAMRYTECKSSRFLQFGQDVSNGVPTAKLRAAAKALITLADKADQQEVTPKDIHKAVAQSIGDKKKNLPLFFPHLLANGTLGLPNVDSKIPPFPLARVVAALRLAIENPDASDGQLLDRIGLPDFPTGGVLTNGDEVRAALESGEGIMKLEAKMEIGKSVSGGERAVVIRNLPFGVYGYDLEEALATLPGVKQVANATSLENGFRIDVTLTADAILQDLVQSVWASPSATNEIPVDLTVVRDGVAARVSLPDLIRYEAARHLQLHGDVKRARRQLDAIADLDAEGRRTNLA